MSGVQKAPPGRAHEAIIIGGGFGGIGMAIELRKRFIQDFVVLEKGSDVGGVWRDNTYPGAACDVPSHLYSFSFEPNANWSHTFSRQPEILDYLRHCADKYDVRRHFRFNTEVKGAEYDEQQNLWFVKLGDGQTLVTKVLITAMGQLSRPIIPKLKGITKFKGPSWHSANWNHDFDLTGKRVAVVGTGASAIQFTPVISELVGELKVFQRTPAYVIPRPDKPYSPTVQAQFHKHPWLMKLHRLKIYLEFESRAIAFTRFFKLLEFGVGKPFRAMLNRQVSDPDLRKKLTPDYNIGCKRVLISSDYFKIFNKPSTQLITDGIKQVYELGIETHDGRRHEVDAIVYGTGFAATEFLAPLDIKGAGGRSLKDEWVRGAKAYLGMTVPHFPNFYMLYGPNTNLGHNSIVYMLESQTRYLGRLLRRQRDIHANRIEVNGAVYTDYNTGVQKALGRTVWNGCKSWYIDENGHNSTGWPGFTLSYRWLTKYSRFTEFVMTGKNHPDVPADVEAKIVKAGDPIDNAMAVVMRLFLRFKFKPWIGKPFGVKWQRFVVALLAPIMPGRLGTFHYETNLNGVRTRVTVPKKGEAAGAWLFLHGGAFCIGAPWTHRAMTTHLAYESGMTVFTPDYRLAPEHPYPACLDDALTAYQALLRMGYLPEQIVVSGDSAGGGLTMALAIRLKELGMPQPAGLAMVSPMIDHTGNGISMKTKRAVDPMLRMGWVEQSGKWLAKPAGAAPLEALEQDLTGMAPMLIQVGDEEMLLSDSLRLAKHARSFGVACELEVYERRWHVFHLQSFYMRSAVQAIKRMATFAIAQTSSTAQSAPISLKDDKKAA